MTEKQTQRHILLVVRLGLGGHCADRHRKQSRGGTQKGEMRLVRGVEDGSGRVAGGGEWVRV